MARRRKEQIVFPPQTILVTPPPYQAPPFEYTYTPDPISLNVIHADSPELSDVREAIGLAEPGDTVKIPQGEARWADMLDVDVPPNVSILGAGDLTVRGGGDKTVIYDDVDDDVSLMVFGTSAEGGFELAGITVRGGSGQLKNNRVIQIQGPSKAIKLHHLSVDTSTYSVSSECKGGAIRTTNWLNGVIYECLFKAYQGVDVWMSTHSGASTGDGSWTVPANLGSSDFVFLEDCEFTSLGGSVCDGSSGGRMVVRYCIGNHLNMHGLCAGRNRGVRAFEWYKNRMVNTKPDEVKANAFNICSGSGVVWGNVCEGPYKQCVKLKIHRNNDDTYSQKPHPEGWGYAGTNQSGVGSPWDGNEDEATGYPAIDQPGHGPGDLLSGSFPNVTNTALGAPGYPRQALEPIYIWDNEWSPVPNNSDSQYISAGGGYFEEGREYIVAPMPGYTPYPYPHPLRSGVAR